MQICIPFELIYQKNYPSQNSHTISKNLIITPNVSLHQEGRLTFFAKKYYFFYLEYIENLKRLCFNKFQDHHHSTGTDDMML